MANVNKVFLVGRLTRDVELKEFDSGATVARFGFATNNRVKKDGEWQDTPVFVDCEAWNRGKYEMASILEKHCQKGSQLHIEGHLVLDQWEGSDGEKRQKLKVGVDSFQFLDSKTDDGNRKSKRHRDDDEDDDDRSRLRSKGNGKGKRHRDDDGDEDIPF